MAGIRGDAPVLQEQEHHRDDQDHRLNEGDDHLLDRELDEGRGVDRKGELHPWRKVGRKLDSALPDGVGGGQGVGAGCEPDRHSAGRAAVQPVDETVAFGAHLHARHIAKPDDRTVGLRLEHNGGELFGCLQSRLRRDDRIERLAGDRRLGADLARGNLDILGEHGIAHVRRHQLEVVELERIEPDSHRILAAKQVDAADPVDAGQWIAQPAVHEVGDIHIGVAAGGVIERNDHQETGAGLADRKALLLYFRWQQRRCLRQMVLHLDLRDVGISAWLEGCGDADRTVRAAGRREVHQVVDAGQLLLDDLGHRGLRRGSVGAGIESIDEDSWRRDGGILRDRQGADRQCPHQHDHQRNDGGEDWPVDEEARHRAPTASASVAWARRERRRPA